MPFIAGTPKRQAGLVVAQSHIKEISMPTQPTDNTVQSPGKNDIENRPVKTGYGMGQDAELDTEAEETEDQEYSSDGLPQTEKYTVDKTSGKSSSDMEDKNLNEQSERKDRSGCGC